MASQKFSGSNHTSNFKQADQAIDVTIFTDPLCCWSWAFQPQLEMLQNYLGDKATWTYRMGGLLPSWTNFHDEVNSVSRPLQMGPVWMHAGQIANMPINHQVWMKDPPTTSYPACIAVKCAQLQSASAGEAYLALLRKACMTDGKNIDKETVLQEAASQLAATDPTFSVAQFTEDYKNGNGIEAFRVDLDLVRQYNINRFPVLVVRSAEQKAIIITGYRPYTEVLKAIQALVPTLTIPAD